jgi:hypothetical protein
VIGGVGDDATSLAKPTKISSLLHNSKIGRQAKYRKVTQGGLCL